MERINWNNFFPQNIFSDQEKWHFISALSNCLSIEKNEKLNIIAAMRNFDHAQYAMFMKVFEEEAAENEHLSEDSTDRILKRREWNEIVKQIERQRQSSPEYIFGQLSKTVVGQDNVLKPLSTLLYLHQQKHAKKLHHLQNMSPVLLAGPTGSGKTLLVRQAARQIEVPFVHIDCSTLTAEGYVGFNPGDIMKEVLRAAAHDEKQAERAIVFLDEFDKLLLKEGAIDSTTQLLRIIEGHRVSIKKERSDNEEFKVTHLDSSHMLFILAGSFEHVLVEKCQNSSGFLSQNYHASTLSIHDLEHAGFPRELLGRVKKVLILRKLDENDYYRILTQSSESPLKKYIQTCSAICDVKVDISEKVIEYLAKEAAGSPYGVRRLVQMTHELFEEILYEAPNTGNKHYHIDTEYITCKGAKYA